MATLKMPAAPLQELSYLFHHYGFVAPAGTTREDLERPDFWSHHAARFQRTDMLRVVDQKESFCAELIVLDAGTGFAKVKVLHFHDLDDALPRAETNSPFLIEWGGIGEKYRVIRKSDRVALKGGFQKKTAAEDWVRQHQAAMAR